MAVFGHTVADNRDLVVKLEIIDNLRVNPTVVVTELSSGLDAAAEGTVLSKFRLDLVYTNNRVILRDVVLSVGNGTALIKTIFTSRRGWGRAVLAEIVVRALAVDQVVGNVLLA